jgi:hypothetical protein
LGGFLKGTIVSRTWTNDWTYFPGDVVTDPSGNLTFQRILKNSNYDRRYAGVELEWNVPITKRFSVLGSYTYGRLMHNTPAAIDNPAYWVLEGNADARLDWDAFRAAVVPGGRDVYNPVRLQQSEHFVKAFFLYDLSTGAVKSNFTFEFQFQSAGPQHFGYTWGIGYPDQLGWYPELITGPAATPVGGTTGRAGMTNAASEYVTMNLSGNNSWGTDFRYLVTVPVYRRLSWMMTIHISNPFNHRGINGWFNAGDHGINKFADNSSANALWPTQPKDSSLGIWRSAGSFGGSTYSRMGGRAVYMNTGIKF